MQALRRWGVILGLLLTAAVALLLRRRGRVSEARAEIKAVRAEARVERALVQQGHAATLRAIQAEYDARSADLSAEQRRQAGELREDPKALARWLATLGTAWALVYGLPAHAQPHGPPRALEAPGRALEALTAYEPPDGLTCAPGAPGPEWCVQAMRPGDRALTHGQLLGTEKAIDVGQRAAYCDQRIRIEQDRLQATLTASIAQAHALWAIERRALERERDAWSKAAAAPDLLPTVAWVGVGVAAVGVVLLVLRAVTPQGATVAVVTPESN